MKFATLTELIINQYHNKQKKLLNFKENNKWRSFSSEEFLENVVYFAYGLQELGFKKGDKLAIYSYQNPIWLIVDFAVMMIGGVSVSIFHNISKENLLYQLEHSETKFIFADNPENFANKNHFDKISCLENELPKNVEKIIAYDFDLRNSNSFSEIIEIGKKKSFELSAGKISNKNFILDLAKKLSNQNPQQLATLIYTSGSTGKPKAVELSHENLVSQIQDAKLFFELKKSDKILSFLPLAHVFERMVMMFYISCGVEIYFVDDVNNVGEFIKEIKPNLMTVVPRLLEKVFIKIKDKANNGSFLKRIIAKSALNHALKKDVGKFSILSFIFDKLVYQKLRLALGGNIKMMICGGAALSQDLERFYHNIGVKIYCGYGLTEAAPVLSANCDKYYKFGSVGKAFNSVELKISDKGELLAKGKNIMIGYYKDSEKTKDTIIDGWLHTQDLATIDSQGFVFITGRVKELFKTANSKYVRPIPIEQDLVRNLGFLTGALVIAEARSFVSALLFADFDLLDQLKAKLKFTGSNQEFLSSEKLEKYVDRKITKINNNLDRGEQIFQFRIIKDEISIENGDITPSMKLKRSFLEQKYSNIIDEIYQ